MDASLFSDFDAADVAAIFAAQTEEKRATGVARAHKSAMKTALRRATSEAHLATILPARFTAGDSWHVISHGDVDALSYLAHAIAGVSHFDYVAISTWCIARADLEQIAKWLDCGKIDKFELYAGEIFPNQYGDEFEMMRKMVADYGCKMVIAKNHSKVCLCENTKDAYYLSMEGSANVNTNPRIEQTTINCDKSIFDFYKTFFNELRSIDKSTKNH